MGKTTGKNKWIERKKMKKVSKKRFYALALFISTLAGLTQKTLENSIKIEEIYTQIG